MEQSKQQYQALKPYSAASHAKRTGYILNKEEYSGIRLRITSEQTASTFSLSAFEQLEEDVQVSLLHPRENI